MTNAQVNCEVATSQSALTHSFIYSARLQTIRQSMEERLVRYYEDLGEPLQVDEDGLIDVSGIAYNDTKFKPFYGTSGRGKLFTTDIDRCLLLTVYK